MSVELCADWEETELKYVGIEPRGQFDDRLVAMANTLARRQVKWSVFERKLFYLTISQLRFTLSNNPTKVILKKKDIYKKLGMSGTTYSGGYLKEQFKQMQIRSFVSWEDENDPDEIWENGFLITHTKATKHEIYVTLSEEFMPLLQELSQKYTMLLLDDLVSFDSKHTIVLYQNLRRIYHTKYLWNEKDFSTKQLKDMFGLSETDYTKKDGKFNRTMFEQQCVQRAVDEINEKSDMMHIEKWWKVKQDGKVHRYVFRYACKHKPPQERVILPQFEAIIEVEQQNLDEELMRLRAYAEEKGMASAEPAEGQFDIYDYLNKGMGDNL
jgi:hypothetical protein